ncbi:MAG: response regulator [Methanomicrobiaceae archaeon]|nr:response regulator [Methanomicrobiaceae archaeon]
MKKILIVDDNDKILGLYSRFIDIMGYLPITVPGGKECLESLEKNIPDLVLLDIMMEPEDGWKTLQRIRKKYPFLELPVIMLTAKVPLPSEICDYGRLIAGFIMKPLTQAQLSEKLKEHFLLLEDIKAVSDRLRKNQVSEEVIKEYQTLSLQNKAYNDIASIFDQKELLPYSYERSPEEKSKPDEIERIRVYTNKIKNRCKDIEQMMK